MNQLKAMDEMKMQIVWGKYNVYFKEGFTPTPNYLAKKCKALNITNAEYRLLTIIFGYGGKDGNAFPSQETLAKDMEVSLRNVQKYLSSLFEKGYLDIINVTDKETGVQRPNHYDLTPLLVALEKLYTEEHGEQDVLKRKDIVATKRTRKSEKIDEKHDSNYPVTEGQGSKQYPVTERQGEGVSEYHPNRIGLKEPLKDFEEEEVLPTVITEADILSLVNAKIAEREITNQKTIKAILDVAANCKQIGGTDWEKAQNYVISIVEDKMKSFGQKQRQKNQGGSNRKSTRKEDLSEDVKQQLAEQAGEKQPQQDNTEDLLAIQRQLEEEMKMYQKETANA
jgi:hypothetical protein